MSLILTTFVLYLDSSDNDSDIDIDHT